MSMAFPLCSHKTVVSTNSKNNMNAFFEVVSALTWECFHEPCFTWLLGSVARYTFCSPFIVNLIIPLFSGLFLLLRILLSVL